MVTNLVGQKFGHLTVIAPRKNNQGRTAWLVRCDCGTKKIVCTGVLNNGSTRSCRCIQRKLARELCRALGKKKLGVKTKHGHFIFNHRSPEYQSWSAMRDRCENPHHMHYHHYGGRGIKICKRWRGEHGFSNFLGDMGFRPEGRTLDRKKVNGNYKPSNCRWATPREQALNRRMFRAIENFPTAVIRAEFKKRIQ